MASDNLENLLKDVDATKRASLRKLLAGTAFAVPTIASYSVKDLSLAEAQSVVVTLISDRNAKEHFAPVDPQAILARVAALAIETWNYKGQDPAVRHLGPMAQDFSAAFGVGQDDRHIHPLDANGVALAAIQGLHRLLQSQHAQIQALTAELTALQAEHRALWADLSALRREETTTA